MKQQNANFEGLKEQIMALNDFMGTGKLFQDFHSFLALITPEKECHAYENDYDKTKIESKILYPEEQGDFYKDKNGIQLNISLKQISVQDLGLAPIGQSTNEGSICCPSYYQDEMSNIEGYAPTRDIMGYKSCNCAVCKLKKKPKQIWEPLDYKMAEEVVKFISDYIENNEVDKKEVIVTRTDEEYKALYEQLKAKYSKKSIDFTDELMKSEIKKDPVIDTVKVDLLKSLKEKISHIANLEKGKKLLKGLFGAEVNLFKIKHDLEKPMEDFCKANKGSVDCVDFLGKK